MRGLDRSFEKRVGAGVLALFFVAYGLLWFIYGTAFFLLYRWSDCSTGYDLYNLLLFAAMLASVPVLGWTALKGFAYYFQTPGGVRYARAAAWCLVLILGWIVLLGANPTPDGPAPGADCYQRDAG